MVEATTQLLIYWPLAAAGLALTIAPIDKQSIYLATVNICELTKTRLNGTKLFCGYCQAAMTGVSGTSRTGTKYHYYQCVTNRRDKSCPAIKRLSAKHISRI